MGEGKSRGVGRHRWILGIALGLVLCGGTVMAGCALDDSAVTAVGGGGGDGSVFDGGTQDATSDAPTCIPKTCANYPSDCHPSLANGCGTTIDCSAACPGGQDCITDAGPDAAAAFFCNGPPVCMDAGAPGGNCNTLTNPGTGQTTNCGSCTDPGFACVSNVCECSGATCNGGALCCASGSGTPDCNDSNNACCKRKTCAADYAGFCNSASDDGCGTSNLNCSANCGGGKVCDTSNSTCCTRESVATACGMKCNTNVQDNCHMTDTCPASCSNGYTCSGTNCTCSSGKTCGSNCCGSASDVCFPSTTCCSPESMSTTCGGGCGNPVPNNCGQNVDCGGCSDGQICKAPGGCTCTGTNGNNNTCNQGQTCHTNGNGSCS